MYGEVISKYQLVPGADRISWLGGIPLGQLRLKATAGKEYLPPPASMLSQWLSLS